MMLNYELSVIKTCNFFSVWLVPTFYFLFLGHLLEPLVYGVFLFCLKYKRVCLFSHAAKHEQTIVKYKKYYNFFKYASCDVRFLNLLIQLELSNASLRFILHWTLSIIRLELHCEGWWFALSVDWSVSRFSFVLFMYQLGWLCGKLQGCVECF